MAQTIPTKNSNKSSFSIVSCCQHAWYKPFFYLFHEMAACCYFGVDLGNWLDHNFPSRLTDGTLHRPSDLLYFSFFLPFTLLDKIFSKSNFSSFLFAQNISMSKIPLHFALPGQKSSKSNSKSTKKFLDNFILCLSRKSLPIVQKNSQPLFFWLRKIPFFAYPFHTHATGV